MKNAVVKILLMILRQKRGDFLNEVYKLLTFKETYSLMWDMIQLSEYTIGSPTGVEFDWEFVMEQEEKYNNIIGFFHTHPFCSHSVKVEYSSTDYNTMCGWVDCFGKPLYCIIGREEQDFYPTVHIFAPKNKIVFCKGSAVVRSSEQDWEAENEYYKGSLCYDKSLFLKDNVLRLPYLCCI